MSRANCSRITLMSVKARFRSRIRRTLLLCSVKYRMLRGVYKPHQAPSHGKSQEPIILQASALCHGRPSARAAHRTQPAHTGDGTPAGDTRAADPAAGTAVVGTGLHLVRLGTGRGTI